MRILEALGEPISYGGEESYIAGLLENSADRGFEIDLLTPYYCDNDDMRILAGKCGESVYALNVPFKPGTLRWREYAPIRSFLAGTKYDIIHIHSGSNTMLAMYAKLAHEAGIKKIIVHSHCAGEPCFKHSLIKRATEGALDRYPTDYCACSLIAAEWRFSRKAVIKTHIMKNGIDLDRFCFNPDVRMRIRHNLSVADNEILLGNVGRLSYQKNQEFILKIMKSLDKRYKLVLVGDGENREMLEALTDKYGLADRVHIIGAVNNVPDYMSAMDLFVFPSRYEGLGIVAVEAQACGLDVLASESITQETTVSDGIRYLSVERPDEWIKAIEENVAKHNGEYTAEVLASGYDVRSTAEAVYRLYEG